MKFFGIEKDDITCTALNRRILDHRLISGVAALLSQQTVSVIISFKDFN